jgi:hypothetical protein
LIDSSVVKSNADKWGWLDAVYLKYIRQGLNEVECEKFANDPDVKCHGVYVNNLTEKLKDNYGVVVRRKNNKGDRIAVYVFRNSTSIEEILQT